MYFPINDDNIPPSDLNLSGFKKLSVTYCSDCIEVNPANGFTVRLAAEVEDCIACLPSIELTLAGFTSFVGGAINMTHTLSYIGTYNPNEPEDPGYDPEDDECNYGYIYPDGPVWENCCGGTETPQFFDVAIKRTTGELLSITISVAELLPIYYWNSVDGADTYLWECADPGEITCRDVTYNNDVMHTYTEPTEEELCACRCDDISGDYVLTPGASTCSWFGVGGPEPIEGCYFHYQGTMCDEGVVGVLYLTIDMVIYDGCNIKYAVFLNWGPGYSCQALHYATYIATDTMFELPKLDGEPNLVETSIDEEKEVKGPYCAYCWPCITTNNIQVDFGSTGFLTNNLEPHCINCGSVGGQITMNHVGPVESCGFTYQMIPHPCYEGGDFNPEHPEDNSFYVYNIEARIGRNSTGSAVPDLIDLAFPVMESDIMDEVNEDYDQCAIYITCSFQQVGGGDERHVIYRYLWPVLTDIDTEPAALTDDPVTLDLFYDTHYDPVWSGIDFDGCAGDFPATITAWTECKKLCDSDFDAESSVWGEADDDTPTAPCDCCNCCTEPTPLTIMGRQIKINKDYLTKQLRKRLR